MAVIVDEFEDVVCDFLALKGLNIPIEDNSKYKKVTLTIDTTKGVNIKYEKK